MRVWGWVALALVGSAAAFGACATAWTLPGTLDTLDRLARVGGQAFVTREATGADVPPGMAGTTVWRAEGAGATTPSDPKPVVIFLHGGGWTDGSAREYGFAGRAFAERGFVTVVAAYRRYPSVKFPAFAEDAADVIRWTRNHIAQYGGDPNRIALAGHSAGAHLATLVALDPRYLSAKGVPADTVKAVVGLAGPYDFLPFTSQSAKAALGSWPRPAETQPITYARAGAPPMLLLTGDADTTVKPRNTASLTAALTKAGSSARAVTYPGVTHSGIVMALAVPFRDKGPVLNDAVDFLNRTMPPKAAPQP